jgi:hypothetical protein
MNRDQFLTRLQKYARKNNLPFHLDKKKGNGSHYRLKLGDKITTVQQELNPTRIERLLKQLGLSFDNIR